MLLFRFIYRWWLVIATSLYTALTIVAASGVTPQKGPTDSAIFWGFGTAFFGTLCVIDLVAKGYIVLTPSQKKAIEKFTSRCSETLDSQVTVFGWPSTTLTDEMRAEIVRLGLEVESFERQAKRRGLRETRSLIQAYSDSAVQFEAWYPHLQRFVAEKRAANPVPEEKALSAVDLAIRRILRPKIMKAERVPQGGWFEATIITAPLAAFSLVTSAWPASYRHPVFLTPEELCEWLRQYDDPEHHLWWYQVQWWDAQLDPRHLDLMTEGINYTIPDQAVPMVIRWGIKWGVTAGGEQSELWCVDRDGHETMIGDLGRIDY